LAALATLRNMTVAEVICQEYGLPRPEAPVPLMLELALEQLPGEDLWQQVAALSLTFTGDDPADQLGVRGGRMLRLVRQLKELVVHMSHGGAEPLIYVSLDGGLGRLHDQSLGKVLGSIYGLEQAAGPYTVLASDPVRFEDQPEQIEKMAELKELVRKRGMSVQLVARAGLSTLDDVRAFLEADVVHAFYLDSLRLGGLNETIEAALAIRQAGKKTLLAGGDSGVLGQLALALRPDLVDPGYPAGSYVLSHEVDRTLAWMLTRVEDG
jgi:methylaspartate ammonia-lyase